MPLLCFVLEAPRILNVTKAQTKTSLTLTCYVQGENVSITWRTPRGFNVTPLLSGVTTLQGRFPQPSGYTAGTYTCTVSSAARCNILSDRSDTQLCFPSSITRTVTVPAYGMCCGAASMLERLLFFDFYFISLFNGRSQCKGGGVSQPWQEKEKEVRKNIIIGRK